MSSSLTGSAINPTNIHSLMQAIRCSLSSPSSIHDDERVKSPANNIRQSLRGNFVARPKNGHNTSDKDSTESKSKKRPIEQYDHKGKTRVNNPPVGLEVCALFSVTAVSQPFAYQSVRHSFHRDGGAHPSSQELCAILPLAVLHSPSLSREDLCPFARLSWEESTLAKVYQSKGL